PSSHPEIDEGAGQPGDEVAQLTERGDVDVARLPERLHGHPVGSLVGPAIDTGAGEVEPPVDEPCGPLHTAGGVADHGGLPIEGEPEESDDLPPEPLGVLDGADAQFL